MSAAQDKLQTTKAAVPEQTPAPVAGLVPSLGRVVLVPESPDHNNGSAVASAVVTAVLANGMVNVRVWADNSDTPEWRTSLRQVSDPSEFEEDGKPLTHVWCWPPRV